MKDGRSITELAKELERQKDAKRDFVVDTAAAHVTVETDNSIDMNFGMEKMPINHHALHQIGDRLKIPAKFADRLATSHPDMLAYNINKLFEREPEKRMVRTLDGNVRAFLSDRYRSMDNYDLADAVLPHLVNHGCTIESCEITPYKMYVKALRPDMVRELPLPEGMRMGDGRHNFFVSKVQAGICLSNSEVGKGRLQIQPAVFTKQCTNFAVFNDASFMKTHLGAKRDGRGDMWELFSDATKEKTDAALWAQVNDITGKALDGTLFDTLCNRLIESRGEVIERDPVKAVEIIAKKKNMTQDEQTGILQHLIKGGELSRYGMHAAITRMSQDVDDYDRASELERVGGEIIEMPRGSWHEIAKAA